MVLELLRLYAWPNPQAIAASTVIDVLAHLGVSVAAARSTLARMTNQGLLERQRSGRSVFFAPSARTRELLHYGSARIHRPIDYTFDGEWTIVSGSVPDSMRSARHVLRARLQFSGFGRLSSGLWLAPSRVDVGALVDDLTLDKHVRWFYAQPPGAVDMGEVVEEAYDLEGLAREYRHYIDRWSTTELPVEDRLAARVLMSVEWVRLSAIDPHLPLDLLPPDWPAVAAKSCFEARLAELGAATAGQANRRIVLMALPAGSA
jgi:phenylacetic acid degradation operon negative regulatory protein